MGKEKSIFDDEYRALVRVLTQERRRLNISQADLAAQLGLHQSDISKVENLERRLDVLEFARLLMVFRVSENHLLAEEIRSFLHLGKP